MHSVAAQRHKLNRVMNFARANAGEAIDLDAMADIACLSKYHLSRVFDTHFGETPAQFLARVRLELAVRELSFMRDRSITEIALGCGFSGSDTFSRSFRNRFSISPRNFRLSNGGRSELFEPTLPFAMELYKPGVQISEDVIAKLQVQIEHRPEYHVAYIRHVGPYGDVNGSITNTFTMLQQWAAERGLLKPETSFLGRCADSCRITPARHCVYDACLVLTDMIQEDNVVSIQTIPAAAFAVVSVACPPEQLNRIWAWMSSCWFPVNGRTLSPKPGYEFFVASGHWPVRSDHGVELCLSILP